MKKLALIFVAIVLLITLLLISNNDDMKKTHVDTSSEQMISDAAITIKLDEFMTAYNEHCGHKYSGTVLVARGDNILLIKGYGVANYEDNLSNEPDSVFAIGSISKSFTAVAIMQLQEKGLLNVNDPISKFIDGHPRGDEITVHHLLTHTSGLVRDGLYYGNKEYIPLTKNINFINTQILLFEPGEDYSYSNAGYSILAAIIEEISGESYNDYIENNIFIPLNMSNSVCGVDASYGDNQSIGYRITTGKPMMLPIYNFSCIIGSGNIYSTVEDMFKYARSFYNEAILGKESLKEIYTTHWANSRDSYSYDYGYGWAIDKVYNCKRVSHGGSIGRGYRSIINKYPENEVCIILLTNNEDSTALNAVSDAIEGIVFNKNYVIPQKAISIDLPNKILENYTGEYILEDDSSILIKCVDERLFAVINYKTYELISIGESKFHFKNYEFNYIEFLMDGYNNVTGISLYSNTKVFKGVKNIC